MIHSYELNRSTSHLLLVFMVSLVYCPFFFYWKKIQFFSSRANADFVGWVVRKCWTSQLFVSCLIVQVFMGI